MKTTRKIVSTPNGGGASENYYGNLTGDHDHILYEVVIKREQSTYAGSGEGILFIGAVSKRVAEYYFGVTDNSDEVSGKFPVLNCPMGAGYSNTITIVDFMEAGQVYPYYQNGNSGGSGVSPVVWASGVVVQQGSSATTSGIRFFGVTYNKDGGAGAKNGYPLADLFPTTSKPFYAWRAYLYRTRL